MIRLAAECGQLHDVDGFVGRMSPGQFDELLAFDQLEPIGNEKICSVIANGFSQLFTMLGSMHRDDGDDPEFYDPDILMPWRTDSRKKQPKEPAKRMQTPNEAAAQFALIAGTYGKPR